MLRATALDEEIRRVTVNGRDFDLDVARNKLLPVVRGGSDIPPTPPPAPPAPPAPPTPPPAPDLTALQTAIDTAKAAGVNETTTALLKALGFDKIEDAQAWVTAKREEETAALTELERREQAAAASETAANERAAEAKKLIDSGVIRLALITAGCPLENIDDAEPNVKITGDVTADTAKTAAEALKAKPAFASLFTVTDPGKPPPAPPIPPGPGPTPPSDPLEAGKARAKTAAASRTGASKEDLLKDFAPQQSPFVNSVT